MSEDDKQLKALRATADTIMVRDADVGARMIMAWLAFYGGPGARKYQDVPRHRWPALLATLKATLDDIFAEPPTLDELRTEGNITLSECGPHVVTDIATALMPGFRKFPEVPPSLRSEMIAAFRKARHRINPAN